MSAVLISHKPANPSKLSDSGIQYFLSFAFALFVSKIEKEVMQEAILKAVEEERRNMEKIHAEEREIWQAECAKDKEKIAQAVQEAVQEQRKTSQVSTLYLCIELFVFFIVSKAWFKLL